MKKKGIIILVIVDIICLIITLVCMGLYFANIFPKAGYVLGIAVGIEVALLFVTVFNYYRKKKNPLATEFDERQKAIRGKCYQIAFFVLVFSLIADGIIRQGFDIVWSSYFTGVLTCICISITIFGVMAIINNAYTAVGDFKVSNGVFFILLGLLNALGVVVYIVDGSLIQNNQLSNGFANLVCAAMLIIIGVVYLVKYHLEQKRAQDEDESDEEFKTKIC